MRYPFIFAALLMLIPLKEVHAYKVEVHAILTDAAARRSVLSTRSFWRRMGFEYVDGQPPRLPITPYRPDSDIIWQDLLDSDGFARGRVEYPRLMAFGADVEDTGVEEVLDSGEQTDISYLSRAFNHFFNPQVDKKLWLTPLVQNHTSPDWVLEPYPIDNQNFSMVDAKVHFFEALLANGVYRDEAFGRVLQTLGHVVHHIQDMAQPQHTRLDSHCDHQYCKNVLDEYFTHDHNDTSVYEIYTKDIIRCGESGSWTYGPGGAYRFDSSTSVPIKCLKTDLEDWDSDWLAQSVALYSYPVVDARRLVNRTPTPRDFWTNERGSGIADFSSKNFMSTDTAFKTKGYWCLNGSCTTDMIDLLEPHSEDLPHPDGQADALYRSNRFRLRDLIDVPSQVPPQFGDAHVDFVSSTFVDQYTGEELTNPRLTSYSIFNERFTKKIATRPRSDAGIHTVNYFNMDEYAKLLMPRAVGYSAGLINYFFRYKLRVEFREIKARPTQRFPEKHEVYLIMHNDSDYDLAARHHQFEVQTIYPGWSSSTHSQSTYVARAGANPDYSDPVVIPAGGSLPMSFDLPYGLSPSDDGEYTGVVRVAFYNKVGDLNAAEAGLQFEIPIALQCGESISAGGGSEGYSKIMSMGSEDGQVYFEFEAFNIPDSLRITNSSGAVLYSTGGFVSNKRSGSFMYDYSRDRQLKIEVVGNSDNGTQWELTISCPN